MRIGIFEGREGKLNKQIIKILAENGELKAWELAKKIYEAEGVDKSRWYSRTQRIYGNLIRRGGALSRLRGKWYIIWRDKEEGKPASLTFKGLLLYSFINPKNVFKIHSSYQNQKLEVYHPLLKEVADIDLFKFFFKESEGVEIWSYILEIVPINLDSVKEGDITDMLTQFFSNVSMISMGLYSGKKKETGSKLAKKLLRNRRLTKEFLRIERSLLKHHFEVLEDFEKKLG